MASEVANAIYQRLRRNDLTEAEADQALNEFLHLPINLFATPELYERAFLFAKTHGITNIYDSLYVVLADTLDAELWTDDRRFLRAIDAPWVRWIGDYQLPSA